MSQYDFGTIDPAETSGAELATILGQWRDALESTHSSATEPSYKQAGIFWVDISAAPTWTLKMYDGAQWIPFFDINTTSNQVTPYVAGSLIGNVAAYSTGTSGSTVPLNSSLGALAYLSVLSNSNQIPNSFILTAHLNAAAVTAAKIATGAIDNANKLADGILTPAKFGTNTPNTFMGWDNSGNPAAILPSSGVTIIRTVYTADGTWTKNAKTLYIDVEVQAPGGAGAGGYSTGSSSCGGPGAGGAYSRKLIPVASLASTETITVGGATTGGAVGTSTQNAATGATTSFGTHIVCTGGTGGRRNNYSTSPGGTASTPGDYSVAGQTPQNMSLNIGSNSFPGGDSFMGFGGKGGLSGEAGGAGTGYGSGGGGGGYQGAGGNGAPGIVIVTEYRST